MVSFFATGPFDDYPDFRQKARGGVIIWDTLYNRTWQGLIETLEYVMIWSFESRFSCSFILNFNLQKICVAKCAKSYCQKSCLRQYLISKFSRIGIWQIYFGIDNVFLTHILYWLWVKNLWTGICVSKRKFKNVTKIYEILQLTYAFSAR